MTTTQLAPFDNVYYELCSEPYWGRVSPEWQSHTASTLQQAESGLMTRHLIAQELIDPTEYPESVRKATPELESFTTKDRLPQADILLFHNASVRNIESNLGVGRVLGQDGVVEEASKYCASSQSKATFDGRRRCGYRERLFLCARLRGR